VDHEIYVVDPVSELEYNVIYVKVTHVARVWLPESLFQGNVCIYGGLL
jgi:hypothetical protein